MGQIDLGQFQFINLDLVRLKTGERWQDIRVKILSVSEHFIEKRLGPGDVLVRCSEGFLVIFEKLDEKAASARVEMISTELNCFFLGDDILRSLKIRSKCERVSTERLAEIMISRGAQPNPQADAPPRTPVRPENDNRDDDEPRRRPPSDFDFRRKESIVYRPVWDSRHQVVTTQFATLRLTETLTGRTYFGYDALRGSDTAREFYDSDRRVAEDAIAELAECVQGGRQLSVCVPVHARTLLSRATRMQYFRVLATVPEPLRRLFYIQIEGIDSGTPASTTQDMCRTLSPFAASMLVRLPADFRHFERFAGSGITVIGCELPDHNSDDVTLSSIVEVINRFERGAALLKASTCFGKVRSMRVLEQAMRGRNRFFAGSLIADEAGQPASAYPLTLEDIRQRAAGRPIA